MNLQPVNMEPAALGEAWLQTGKTCKWGQRGSNGEKTRAAAQTQSPCQSGSHNKTRDGVQGLGKLQEPAPRSWQHPLPSSNLPPLFLPPGFPRE